MKKLIAIIMAAALIAAIPLSAYAKDAVSAAFAEASGEVMAPAEDPEAEAIESAEPSEEPDAVLSEAASDDSVAPAGTAEEKISDELVVTDDDSMLLETTGIGSGDWVYEKAEGSATLIEYRGKNMDVVIPDKIDGYTVTSLGDELFNEADITSVVIPDSVINIGSYAFYDCIYLTSIKFGSKVENIDYYAFYACTSVETLELPNSLLTIGEFAFQHMTGLRSVNIPKNVTLIGREAFDDTESLEEIQFNAVNCETEGNVFNNAGSKAASLTFTIGKGVVDVPANLCYSDDDQNCPCITSLVLPATVKTVGENAFCNCEKLVDISWPTNLELIDEFAFSGCNSLKKIIFPKGLKTIEMSAFSSCFALENISFMAGVTNIGYAFDYCENLQKVYVYGKNTSIVHDQFDWSKPDVKIYCHKGSPADDMAQDCGYKFEYFTRSQYYPDVPPDHSYQKAVYWATDEGIAAGYNNGRFGVADNITRGQVVMFIWRMAGKPEPKNNTQTFTDVPTTHSYYKAIQWASEKKITAGFKNGSFGVNNNCTRGQIVTFLWRYKNKPKPATTKQSFKDIPKTHNYFTAIQWAYEKGVTAGYADNTFRPQNTCTRGQCVTFIYRMAN